MSSGKSARDEADEALFAALYPALRAFAAVTRSPGMDPDDLVQEAVSRALRRGPLAALDNPGAYLRSAIVNIASNDRRSWGRGVDAHRRDQPSQVHADSYAFEAAEVLRLPPVDRAIVWLLDVEGWRVAEVARLLDMSPLAARKRASRSRGRLRRLMGADE